MNELALRMTAEETRARNAWAEAQAIRRFNEMTAELAKETLNLLSRKCICCGGPGYEVDH